MLILERPDRIGYSFRECRISTWTGTYVPPRNYSWTYDADSRIKTMTTPDGTDTFTLDTQDQLTNVTGLNNQTYAYDGNGNRTNTGYST